MTTPHPLMRLQVRLRQNQEGESSLDWTGPLGEFLRANRFTLEEALAITRAIRAGAAYAGGGGAQASWCLSPLNSSGRAA